MEKLLPCPFCGGRSVLIFDFSRKQNVTDGETWQKTKVWWIKCDDCQVSQWRFKSRQEAVEEWNTRFEANPSATNPVVDQKAGNINDK